MKRYLKAGAACFVGAGVAFLVAAFALLPLLIFSRVMEPVPDVVVGIMLGLVFAAFFDTASTYAKSRVEEEESRIENCLVAVRKDMEKERTLLLQKHDDLVNELRVAKQSASVSITPDNPTRVDG